MKSILSCHDYVVEASSNMALIYLVLILPMWASSGAPRMGVNSSWSSFPLSELTQRSKKQFLTPFNNHNQSHDLKPLVCQTMYFSNDEWSERHLWHMNWHKREGEMLEYVYCWNKIQEWETTERKPDSQDSAHHRQHSARPNTAKSVEDVASFGEVIGNNTS